jgi:hypothetical protein
LRQKAPGGEGVQDVRCGTNAFSVLHASRLHWAQDSYRLSVIGYRLSKLGGYMEPIIAFFTQWRTQMLTLGPIVAGFGVACWFVMNSLSGIMPEWALNGATRGCSY